MKGAGLGAGAHRVDYERLLDQREPLDQRCRIAPLLEDPTAGRVRGAQPGGHLQAGAVIVPESVADADQREPGPVARLGGVLQRDAQTMSLMARGLDIALELVAMRLHQ